MEVGALVGTTGVTHWHIPTGRTKTSLPDDSSLWNLMWDNRTDSNLGFAHVHPDYGQPFPSYEDVTTFAAVEAALGRRITWWILSSDETSVVKWKGPEILNYSCESCEDPSFASELRLLSEKQ